ncbi:hypothetical protein C8R44DRAFT_980651 [Mycena epipterygia]|nr:hypothetical protein C8R44DRAFT_980651 [Mycena epipterygia]
MDPLTLYAEEGGAAEEVRVGTIIIRADPRTNELWGATFEAIARAKELDLKATTPWPRIQCCFLASDVALSTQRQTYGPILRPQATEYRESRARRAPLLPGRTRRDLQEQQRRVELRQEDNHEREPHGVDAGGVAPRSTRRPADVTAGPSCSMCSRASSASDFSGALCALSDAFDSLIQCAITRSPRS